jgi:hypothetical protein
MIVLGPDESTMFREDKVWIETLFICEQRVFIFGITALACSDDKRG